MMLPFVLLILALCRLLDLAIQYDPAADPAPCRPGRRLLGWLHRLLCFDESTHAA